MFFFGFHSQKRKTQMRHSWSAQYQVLAAKMKIREYRYRYIPVRWYHQVPKESFKKSDIKSLSQTGLHPCSLYNSSTLYWSTRYWYHLKTVSHIIFSFVTIVISKWSAVGNATSSSLTFASISIMSTNNFNAPRNRASAITTYVSPPVAPAINPSIDLF